MKPKKLSASMFVYFVFFTMILPVMPLMPQGKLIVHVGIDPPAVSVGQPTEIRLEVFSAPGNPLPDAHVEISAGGGVFLDSGGTVVGGQTGGDGMYVTPWKCDQCADAYVFNIEVNKPGFKGWNGETRVEITGEPGPVQGGPIQVNAGTHPDTVSAGQPTEIRVEAFSHQGDPIPGAHVKISAGGGMFLDSNGLIIEGQTDINGVFVTPWKCIQCASAYVFDIEVNKPGFEPGKAEAKVNIQ